MSVASRARLRISWLSVRRGVSRSSAGAEPARARRSTSKVAVDRYTSGRNAATLTAAVNVAVKTRSTSRLRRRHVPGAARKPGVVPALSPMLSISEDSSGHEDDVTPAQVEIVLLRVPRDHLLVTEGDALQARSVLAENDDPTPGGEVVEPLGHRDGVQHRGSAPQLVAPWLL